MELVNKLKCQPMNMGDSRLWCELGHFAAVLLSPASAGLNFLAVKNLGLTPQALRLRLLRRLNQILGQQGASSWFMCHIVLVPLCETNFNA